MKRILAAVMAVLVLCCPMAYAWEGPFDGVDEIPAEDAELKFDFEDDGYDGEWVQIDALNIEFCLPQGWSEAQPSAGDVYAAASPDGRAALAIRMEGEHVSDLQA